MFNCYVTIASFQILFQVHLNWRWFEWAVILTSVRTRSSSLTWCCRWRPSWRRVTQQKWTSSLKSLSSSNHWQRSGCRKRPWLSSRPTSFFKKVIFDSLSFRKNGFYYKNLTWHELKNPDYPPASKANLTWRKNPHAPIHGVKEFVCLSVCLSVMNFDLNYLKTGKKELSKIFYMISLS